MNAYQTIKQIFFSDKIYLGKRLYYIEDATNYDYVFYRVRCFCCPE